MDEGAKLTWMRQPHYYMGLYPYTYAAGLTASTAAAQKIREEGQPAVDRWLEALKAGGSLPPQELMKLAGADMSGLNLSAQPLPMSVVWWTNLNVCIPDLHHIVYGQGRTGVCTHLFLNGRGELLFCLWKGSMCYGGDGHFLVSRPVKRGWLRWVGRFERRAGI